ncbi:nickel-dependent hydrogenase large subunit [Rhodoblastus acidophilus]|uniref:Nickel-dependent hydrogenase large subunit n=1 Tax=Candidatus Rhodoblastus alkanivorans TaxID=2954117 RepID=A0ABS9Z425_9HYPH|nr:nickel-dependent hydrogenase large subunit [Candidatus Rhodoblastus alkanivorans]MCI4677452.1 nickel-dependent hydrogenase large subunit [Candidatus Rhodoblastus alkanivorans]MCI4681811.1 nickel-dependent hydrogenase large subunit [Candidatus Rhodoblastus alkanivorans]MDI4642861.1 nickel-dependent hydrogenase large subunit [Rhodoblastus acidophilus]
MSAAAACLILRAKLRDGMVENVEIVSPRADPSPIFIGLAPKEAAVLAGRLFSLCPASQSIAAQAASEAALGVAIDAASRRTRALNLLCERLGEMLRASLLDWPRDGAPAPEDVLRLRDALRLLRALPQAPDAARMRELRAATGALGLNAERGENFFARQLAEARADDALWTLPSREADFLSAADDGQVRAAMSRDAAFSRAPELPGRRPETGAGARQGRGGGVAARLAARIDDMAATVEAIEKALQGGDAPDGLLCAQGEGGQGFAAVDSARGRLYHFLRLDGAGRIADYRIVAPTEWNFHPEGPCVHALRGARIGAGAEARRRVERLAFVFDPCIRAIAELPDKSDA